MELYLLWMTLELYNVNWQFFSSIYALQCDKSHEANIIIRIHTSHQLSSLSSSLSHIFIATKEKLCTHRIIWYSLPKDLLLVLSHFLDLFDVVIIFDILQINYTIGLKKKSFIPYLLYYLINHLAFTSKNLYYSCEVIFSSKKLCSVLDLAFIWTVSFPILHISFLSEWIQCT